jgi:hypothetical protein
MRQNLKSRSEVSLNLSPEPRFQATLGQVRERAHRRQPIIVLGMHRSGTSLVAELIDKWGAFGSDQFLAADYRNSQGYWEYEPLVHFNRRLLVSVESQSFVPPSDKHEATLRERALEPAWRSEARQLVSAMEGGQRAWYWKDPRLAVTLPFWQQFWDDPIYVITVREPVDTALSLHKIYKLPMNAGYLLWQRYLTAALRLTANAPQRLFVQYERLLSGPAEQCRRLCGFLEQSCGPDPASTGDQRVDAMLPVVNPSLQSNAQGCSFLSSSEASEEQKNLYRYVQAMAMDQDGILKPSAYEIFAGWRDYLQALATVEQLRDGLTKQQQTLAARIQRKLVRKPPIEELPW